MHVFGTRVPRCFGVAPSASSPKAAQALGCSLTSGLWISFGRVTCMARAASVPGLWTLGFLLLRGACVWVWVVVGFRFRLRPASRGWGVGVCVCLCACSACTPPLLAGVCSVGVCAWVPAAPRHSWLGCWVVCVRVCALCLHPATPGWGVRCGCVSFGSGFGCSRPLLAGVLGCVYACVRAPLVPRHSWLGCAARVLCLGSGLGCAPPLLAGVSEFVSACVRAPLAPRHSWLGCAVCVCVFGLGFRLRPATPRWGVGVCVLVCVLHLYPPTPGWGARSGCVCLGSHFGCAPPLLAGVLGCVCGGVGAPLVPRHSWLGCAFWVWVFGLGFQLRPATPGWGVGCGCVCLGWGFGCAPPLLAGGWGVRVCVSAPLVTRHSWLGCAAWVCVLGFGFRLRPSTPGWAVGVCVCSCARSACGPRLVAEPCGVGVGVWAQVLAAPRHAWLGCWGVLVRVRAPLVARHSWLGRAAWMCVWVRVLAAPRLSWLGCWGVCVVVWALPLYPATPGWAVRCGCGCLGSGSGCAPPLLAGVWGVGVCVWARVSAAPRHSWLGCWGVRVCVRAPLVPRHSWLGCAAWVCVLGLGFRLRPASPGWGVEVCLLVCVLPL